MQCNANVKERYGVLFDVIWYNELEWKLEFIS